MGVGTRPRPAVPVGVRTAREGSGAIAGRRGPFLFPAACLMAAFLAAPARADAPRAQPDAAPQVAPGTAGTANGSLVKALAQAKTREESDHIAAQLEALRQSRLSPTARLLLRRAHREVGDGKPHDALGDSDDAVALQPDLPIALRERAAVRFAVGDTAGAEADLGASLGRDADDAAAWAAMSQVEEGAGRFQAAYAAWEHVLRLQPMIGDGARRLNELRRQMMGEPT